MDWCLQVRNLNYLKAMLSFTFWSGIGTKSMLKTEKSFIFALLCISRRADPSWWMVKSGQ